MSSNSIRYRAEIFESKVYDVGITKDHYDVVVDVGANVGHFSEYIYDKAGIIYAIEPSKDDYLEIVKLVEEKKLHKIKPFNVGLGSSNTTALFDPVGETIVWGHGTIPVKITTLQTFIEENDIKKIDLLKIDCEGCEQEVFEESFSAIKIPIYAIVGEQHGGFSALSIEKYGYKVVNEQIFTATKI